MGPGFYSDIGRHARDLLFGDYQTNKKFILTTYTLNGVAISVSGREIDKMFFGELQSQFKTRNIVVDVRGSSYSTLMTTLSAAEFVTPGLSSILSFTIPHKRSGKIELQYLNDFAGITAGIGLASNPIVSLSTVVGTSSFAVGADVSFDTAKGKFSKCNAGFNIIYKDLTASLTVDNKGESATASFCHMVNPLSTTVVGAQITHSFWRNENALEFGAQHNLDPSTTVKARINNFGRASALIQHEWRRKSFFTITGEVDTTAPAMTAKVGLAVVLKPQ